MKQWKLSPMDVESRRRWEEYTKAKEVRLQRSHIPEARWWVVHAVDKKRARLKDQSHRLVSGNSGSANTAVSGVDFDR
jgi:polyphosphate kinase